MNVNNLCMSCMQIKPVEGRCPFCGFEESEYAPVLHQLPMKTILGAKYLVGKVIGEGGFGITYIGYDLNLDLRVAIKEFYPTGFATRENTKTNTVTPFVGDKADFFSSGREKFIHEARRLARFRNLPGIVAVNDFIMENGTAYIVMEFIDGVTFKQYLAEKGGKLPSEQVFELMYPVMDSLGKMHHEGIMHRDISPDNIMISKDGRMRLIDFGAARDFIDKNNKSLSILLKPGYAPIEQYSSKGAQGPWTDLYAMCATMYRAITGVVPDDASDRVYEDEVKRPSQMGIVMDSHKENVMMKGMSIYGKDRYQSVDELMLMLYNAKPIQAASTGYTQAPQAQVETPQPQVVVVPPVAPPEPAKPVVKPKVEPKSRPEPKPRVPVEKKAGESPGKMIGIAVGVVAAVILAVVLIFSGGSNDGGLSSVINSGDKPGETSTPSTTSTPRPTTEQTPEPVLLEGELGAMGFTSEEEAFDYAHEMYDLFLYEDAAPVLQALSNNDHGMAQYLLGFCYLNGYAVEEDDDYADELFDDAGYNMLQQAEDGDYRAQFWIAVCYSNGRGVVEDEDESQYWYSRAVESIERLIVLGESEPEALYFLGLMYERGGGVPLNYAMAVEYFHEAVLMGENDSTLALGDAYSQGYGVEIDLNVATAWYESALDLGFESAEDRLEEISESNYRTNAIDNLFEEAEYAYEEGDYNKAFQLYGDLAVFYNHTTSMHRAGSMLYNGMGLEQDIELAIDMFEIAADSGLVDSMLSLGWIYSSGEYVEQDVGEAIFWYSLAESYGSETASERLRELEGGTSASNTSSSNNSSNIQEQYDLASSYYSQGDYDAAFEIFYMLASNGHAASQYWVGYSYDYGLTGTWDYAVAADWYTLAASQGIVAAQTRLGSLYESGNGVSQSYSDAVYWYTLAADNGDMGAQYLVSFLYRDGLGTAQSYDTALYYLDLAASQGHEAAGGEAEGLRDMLGY